MIFVDAASGSNTLAPLLRSAGLPVFADEDGNLPHLDYADVEFVGRGDKGKPVLIGVEVKRLSELTGDWDRFAGHQVKKMNENYAHRYLLVEGEWMQSKRGTLLKRSGRRTFRPLHGQNDATQLRKKLFTLEMCGGFHVMLVNQWGRDKSWTQETVRRLMTLYYWWTDEDLDKHKSHIVHYIPQGIIPLNRYEQAFAGLPGISSKRAKHISKHFKGSLRKGTAATITEWAGIEVPDDEGRVRHVGTKLATDISAFFDGQ